MEAAEKKALDELEPAKMTDELKGGSVADQNTNPLDGSILKNSRS